MGLRRKRRDLSKLVFDSFIPITSRAETGFAVFYERAESNRRQKGTLQSLKKTCFSDTFEVDSAERNSFKTSRIAVHRVSCFVQGDVSGL